MKDKRAGCREPDRLLRGRQRPPTQFSTNCASCPDTSRPGSPRNRLIAGMRRSGRCFFRSRGPGVGPFSTSEKGTERNRDCQVRPAG